MAKTNAPLFSFGASGQLGKSLVASRWRGISYTRRYVIPSNPRTQSQTDKRVTFANLQGIWKYYPAGARAPWDAAASGKPFLGVNKFTGDNMKVLAPASPAPTPADLAEFVGSSGANGGPAPGNVTPVGGALQITVTLAAPTLPAGWSITRAQGVAIADQAPDAAWPGGVQYQEDLATPFSLVFTGLAAATDYMTSVWFEYERPDGKLAYSVSVTDITSTS